MIELPPQSSEVNESESKLGRNVTIRAMFLRHGEKEFSPHTAETGLSATGRDMSDQVGQHFEDRPVRKSYSSDTARTIETAQRIIEASKTQKRMKLAVKGALAFRYDQGGQFVADAMRIKQESCGPDFKEVSQEEQAKRLEQCHRLQMEDYLRYGDERPDPNTYSPVETASLIARRVDLYIRMANRLYSDSDIDLINATHDYPIGCFIKETIGQENLQDINLPIDFVEGFQVEIKTDGKGQKSTNLQFLRRNKNNALIPSETFELDTKRLNELVSIAKKLEEKERKEAEIEQNQQE